MSLKAKLISTISAMCLVIALVSVGVWAASTATINLGGTLTFNATDVYCTVEGTFSGMNGTAPTLSTLTWDSKATSSTTPTSGDPSTWANKALTFDDKGTQIQLTITITNKSAERGITVVLTDTKTTAVNGLGKAITYGGSNYTSGTSKTLAEGQNVTIVITFSLTNANLDTTVDAEWGYTLSLSNAG